MTYLQLDETGIRIPDSSVFTKTGTSAMLNLQTTPRFACSCPYFLGTAAATAALAANNLGGSGIGTTVNQTAFGSASNHGLKPVQTTTNHNTTTAPTTKVQVNEAANTTININGTNCTDTITPKIPPPIPPRKNSKKNCHQRAVAVFESILKVHF